MADMPYEWTDLPFFLALPALLIASGFFSGSETALFGLSEHQRFRLSRQSGLLGNAIRELLVNRRLLLVTLMLGNMAANTLYMVIAAALLIQLEGKPNVELWYVWMSAGPLLGLILLGELLPKLSANTARLTWVRIVSIPLFLLHRLIGPFTRAFSQWVIEPLGRLIAPPAGPTRVTRSEVRALLEMSRGRGVIGEDEQQLIGDLIQLTQLKVRDLMIPRVDVHYVDADAPADEVRAKFNETGMSKLVVVDRDLDHVLGLVYRRQFLLTVRRNPDASVRAIARGVRFVPEMQHVDQLMADFRRTGTKFALVVDEYGGTAGIVTLKDIVERLVGELDLEEIPPSEPAEPTVETLDKGLWRIGGRLSVHDWAQYFPGESIPPRVATVGGLVMALAGQSPHVGQCVQLGNVQMEVERVTRGRVESVLLRLRYEDENGGAR